MTVGPPATTLLVAAAAPFADDVAGTLRGIERDVSVVTATDGAGACEATADRPLDGVVVDDRLDAPLRVVSRAADAELPVVFVTDDPGDEETVRAALDAGATDCRPRVASEPGCRLLLRHVRAERGATDGARRTSDATGAEATEGAALARRLDGYPDLVVVHDPETGDLAVNDRVCDLLGRERASVEAAPPGDRGFLDELVAAESPGRTELAIASPDDETVWVEFSTAPVGGTNSHLSVGRDVTERKRTERRFETIADRVDEVLHFVDADRREVLYANPAFETTFGRSLDAVYEDPETFYESIHPDDVEEHKAAIASMLADMDAGDPDDRYDFAFRVIPDDEVRWLESRVYPLRDDPTGSNRYVGVTEDVTARRERERTLETFHEATRSLTAADSREAACRRATTAAADVLGFPAVASYLFGEGRLEPVASTGLDAPERDLPAFAPDESLPWQVYVEDESVACHDRETGVFDGVGPDPDLVLSLGSHGVMLVGTAAASLDDGEVELAQILAATLEAALNHLAGERVLAERERELRREQARADRLERFNAVIREVEEATVEQSSRADVERAVCERLAESDLADLVWIAEPSVDGDDLEIRTAEGDPATYLDSLPGVLGVDATRHPAGRVYRSGEPRAVESVAGDVAGGEWRTLALRHGVQSVVAVPVTHGDRVHGVLTVAATAPDAFDEATRSALAELGRSVGYAITVTERRRALASEGTTELEFSVRAEGLFMVRAAAEADCRVDLERTVRRAGGGFSTFYAVEGADPARVADLAAATPSVESSAVVTGADDGTAGVVEVEAPTWFGEAFSDYGAVVREASAQAGRGTVVVEAPHGADVRGLVETFRDRYHGTELAAKRQCERTINSLFGLQDLLREELTDRQWQAFQTAYSTGYFSWPREVSGAEVAELMGVTQPTFNKHLRLAEQTAVRLLLERPSRADDR